MNELSTIVNSLLADPLAPARARAQAGGRVVGLLGEDIPMELVRAAGAAGLQLAGLQVRDLMATGVTEDGSETPHADRYLEASFPPSARQTVEAWLTGAFDFLDAVIFSRSNDSTQRLYYYLCELQRRGLAQGPRPLLYDLAKIPRASSQRHTQLATLRLARELAVDVGSEALSEAIRVRNRRRALFRELEDLRATDHPPRGTDVNRVLRASDLVMAEPGDAGIAAFDEALSGWIHSAAAAEPAAAQSVNESARGPRVLLAGSVPPDERLHAAVEQGGGCVVGEVGSHSPARLGEPVPLEPSRPAIDALADHHHALCFGPRAFYDRARAILDDALRLRADGVVLWLIEEDESMAWDVPPIRQALASQAIAHLVLTRQRADCSDGALDRVAEFVASLHACAANRGGVPGAGASEPESQP